MPVGYDFTLANNHVQYLMGSKNVQRGVIDCSGWIDLLNKQATQQIAAQYGADRAKTMRVKADGGAAGIIQDQVNRGNLVAKVNSWSQITPDMLHDGMVIGEARGKHAKGRYGDIGHIVAVVEKDGKKYISEATSARGADGKTGVRLSTVEEYIARNKNRQFDVHITNPYKGLNGDTGQSSQQANSNTQEEAIPTMQVSAPTVDTSNPFAVAQTQAPTTTDPFTRQNATTQGGNYGIFGADIFGGSDQVGQRHTTLSAVQTAAQKLLGGSLFKSMPLDNGVAQLFDVVDTNGSQSNTVPETS